MNELERLRSNCKRGQVAPGLWLTLQVDLGQKPNETAKNFLGVIQSWISVVEERGTAQETWPTDKQWEHLLPSWFIRTFKESTPDDIHESGWRWDYGSWLDSMRERVWQWWGYQQDDKILTVQLQLDSWPYSIGALKYLARVAGGRLAVIEDKGCNYANHYLYT
jgi:hypothetical protein